MGNHPTDSDRVGGIGAISVVIRSRNSEATLEAVISGLGLGTGDQLIVVDHGSVDGTRAIAGRHGAEWVEYVGPFNFSRALNLGFAAARCAHVLAISSHCVPVRPGLLGRYREALKGIEGGFGVACGSASDSLRVAQSLEGRATVVSSERLLTDGGSLPGNQNSLYWRAEWERHPFDERIVSSEDLEWRVWAAREGVRVVSCPGCAIHYRNRGPLRHLFRKGWNDSMVARHLLEMRPMTPRRLAGIWWGALRRWMSGEYDGGAAVRNVAQSAGFFLGSRRRDPQVYRAWEK